VVKATPGSLDCASAKVAKSLGKQVEKGRMSESDLEIAMSMVRGVTDLQQLSECDLVIESVIEDLAVKKELFGELDRVCGPHAILATNTSTLPVVEMAMATGRPEQVCGIHFFNPAPLMGLVEVVRAITTSDETIVAARSFAESCGKSPVEVKDVAGFVVNALLFPYLNNAVRLLEGGVAGQDDIDAAMRNGAGFPMGPFQLLDLVGLDVSVAILDALYAENPDPFLKPAQLLRRMVSAGRLGKKSGHGFYEYSKK
jgi:3-hydroxybutyryl-CoA dehydrogenase